MENNELIIGKVVEIPPANDTHERIFSVSENETENVVNILVRGNDVLFRFIKVGDPVEVIGTAIITKVNENGKAKCLKTILASSIAVN